MTGGVKRKRKRMDALTAHRCSVADCERPARTSCFECERFCCARHLIAVSVATATFPVRVRVCPDCYQRYQSDPDIAPLLNPDASRISNHS